MSAKLKTLAEAPPEAQEAIAKAVNKGYEAVSGDTRKKIWEVMGKTGDADAKKLVEAADAAKRKTDLEKLSTSVLKNHAVFTAEKMRAEIHDQILTLLSKDKIEGPAGQKHEFEDVEAAIPKFKKPDAPAPRNDEPEVQPSTEESIPTADRTAYTSAQTAKVVGGVGAGLALGSVASGVGSMFTSPTGVPLLTRFYNGFSNFWGGARDIFLKKTGIEHAATNWIWNPLNTLAGKLGIATGPTANTAALAGLPSWVAPVGLGAAVVGGAYAGSKVVNWLGNKVGVKPTTIPIIGRLPIIGGILNSFLTVPPNAAGKGNTKIGEGVQSGWNWLTTDTSEAQERRANVKRFGFGFGAAALLTPLTLPAALLAGHVFNRANKDKKSLGEILYNMIPAPFGTKKAHKEAGHA